MSEQNKALIRRLFAEDINPGNAAVAAEIIHPDFHDHTNPPEMQHGLDGHNAIVALFRTAFTDMWWHIHEMIAEGDKVVVRTTMEATHTGEFFGIPPTDKRVSLDGIHILRIADGRIAEHWGNNDDLGMMRQLGVIPSPEPVPA